MNRVVIDLLALHDNLRRVHQMVDDHAASWTVATKALCGHPASIEGLCAMGVRSVADSRLASLRTIAASHPEVERWYLRPPQLSAAREVVRLAHVSLNSEIATVRALSRAARKQRRTHRIVIMIELGDRREGVLPGGLTRFYAAASQLPHIEIVGIGAQLGCLSGAVPDRDQLDNLALYRELLRAKFDHDLPLVSAGSSIFLSPLADGSIPDHINHYRVGEALFLGTDLMGGGTLPGIRDDVIRLEAEVVEIKEKSLTSGEGVDGCTPFECIDTASEPPAAGQRGFRALLALGQLDTQISGLTPLDPRHQIAGASSDLTALNLGDDPGGLSIGDTVAFRLDYGALVRAMNDPYLAKQVEPSLDQLRAALATQPTSEVRPALQQVA